MHLRITTSKGNVHEGRELEPAQDNWGDEAEAVRENLDKMVKDHCAVKPDDDTWVMTGKASGEVDYGLAQDSATVLIPLVKGVRFELI